MIMVHVVVSLDLYSVDYFDKALVLFNSKIWVKEFSNRAAGWWLSLLHLISNFSGPQTPSRFPRAPSAGCGFPYHISSTSPPTLTGIRTLLTFVLTELYPSSTPTRSPTRSLKSHVWSLSSGNNCSKVTLFRCISLWV